MFQLVACIKIVCRKSFFSINVFYIGVNPLFNWKLQKVDFRNVKVLADRQN